MTETKVCSKCKIEKPLEDYHRERTVKSGRRASCKACDVLRSAGWYRKNKRRSKIVSAAWRENNRDKYAAGKKRARLAAYGLTVEGYNAMLIAQAGRCAICAEPMISAKGPCIDHDHSTGRVRELLCNNCNSGIGKLKEDPKIFAAALAYLNRHHPERNRA